MTDKEIFQHRFHKANIRKSTKQLAKELKIPLRAYEAALIKVKAAQKLEDENLKEQVDLLEKQNASLKDIIKQNEKRISQLVSTVGCLQNEKKKHYSSLKSKMQSAIDSAVDKVFKDGGFDDR